MHQLSPLKKVKLSSWEAEGLKNIMKITVNNINTIVAPAVWHIKLAL